MRGLAVTLLLLLLAGATLAAEEAAPANPAPVEVRTRVEPDTTTIGTRFRYTIEVAAGRDVEVVVAQPSEKIGDFDIVDFGVEPAREQGGKTVLTRWYTLVGWKTGHHLVKSPPIQYRQPGEELREAPGHETRVSLESLLAKEPAATDIRDIKGPEPVPFDWRPYYLLGGILAALVGLATLLYRLANRPKRARPAAPPRPPHELAAEALERLRQRRLIEQGAFKEYYSALSAIVRTYLEQRFGLRAPEMTTEEFLLATARDGRLQPPHRRLLGDFLSESDLVKFARHLPTIADSERAYTAGRRFVDETTAGVAREDERAAG